MNYNNPDAVESIIVAVKQDRALTEFLGTPDPAKVQRIEEAMSSGTSREVKAVAAWLGAQYRDMAKTFYAPTAISPERRKAAIAATELAISGLKKLPAVTEQELVEGSKRLGDPIDLTKPLHRYMRDMDSNYIGQFTVGELLPDVGLFAASYAPQEPVNYYNFYGRRANLRFDITAKLDGTGAGRYIDDLKTSAVEREILFTPDTKFLVKSIKTTAKPLPVVYGLTEAENDARLELTKPARRSKLPAETPLADVVDMARVLPAVPELAEATLGNYRDSEQWRKIRSKYAAAKQVEQDLRGWDYDSKLTVITLEELNPRV